MASGAGKLLCKDSKRKHRIVDLFFKKLLVGPEKIFSNDAKCCSFFELENSETFGATTSFQTEDSIVKTEGLFETTDTTIAQLPDVNFEGNFV